MFKYIFSDDKKQIRATYIKKDTSCYVNTIEFEKSLERYCYLYEYDILELIKVKYKILEIHEDKRTFLLENKLSRLYFVLQIQQNATYYRNNLYFDGVIYEEIRREVTRRKK